MLLIDVGLLALVAGSTVLVRQTNELRARSSALQAASNRLQTLGGSGCQGSSGATDAPDGSHERWQVSVPAAGIIEIRDSVGFLVGRIPHAVTLRTRLPC